jgi:uncharacterized protein (DUF2235 family)
MSKRIIFCADGTWQDPLNNTNVYRIYKGLVTSSVQVPYYDDGVGADGSGIERLIQGAIGEGLLQKIKDGYAKIAHVYEAGDQVSLFGFSRGAYTARSLAGMLASCGVPSGAFDDGLIDTVFNAYRNPTNRDALLAPLKGQLIPCAIELVGVWDTVGALGIPAIFGGFDEKQFGFLDTKLHPDVKNAFQCLSIDEQRRQFTATVWDSDIAPGQTLEQVYFSGCHGDVGGGTAMGEGVDATTRLCDITLGYMVQKATTCGLTFDPTFIQQCATLDPQFSMDMYRDSWDPKFQQPLHRIIADTASIANSVTVRMQYLDGYAPPNLKTDSGVLSDCYSIVDVVAPTP